MPARASLVASILVALAVAWSCTWGGYTPGSLTGDGGAGEPCALANTTSCAGTSLCVANVCRATCGVQSDCPSGFRCLYVGTDSNSTSANQGVCVDSMPCNPNGSNCSGSGCSFCPNGTMCAGDGQCRNQCMQANMTGSPPSLQQPEPPPISSCGGGSCQEEPCTMGGPCGSSYCYGPHEAPPDGGADAGVGSGALVTTVQSPGAVASTGTALFWVQQSGMPSIWYCTDPTNCQPQEPTQLPLNGAPALAAGPQGAYWATSSGLVGCPATGCGMPVAIAATGSQLLAVAANGSTVVWVDVQGDVWSCSGTIALCGMPTRQATGANGSGVAIDENGLFYFTTRNGKIASCAGTCPLAPMMIPIGASQLAAASGHLYYVGLGSSSQLYACDPACTSPQPISQINAGITHIAADSAGVFWTTGSGAVMGCNGAPCQARSLGQINNGQPAGITTDMNHVYVTVSSNVGSILSFPKN